jgi:hypothetical protein
MISSTWNDQSSILREVVLGAPEQSCSALQNILLEALVHGIMAIIYTEVDKAFQKFTGPFLAPGPGCTG